MKNDLLTIGSFTIHGYGLMIGIGILAAYGTAVYRARRKGLDADALDGIAVWGVVAGLLGAKLLYYITSIPYILEDPSILLNVADGFVVYGGIIGGIFGGYCYTKRRKLNFVKYVDLVLPSVALAQGFGRIGCLLAGCCYGRETESAFHIIFRESQFAPNNVALIPTQILSSALNFAHFAVLVLVDRKVKKDGVVASLYLIFYSVGRFILEFFRGDLVRGSVGALSTSQFISLFIFAIGLFCLIWSLKKEDVQKGNLQENDVQSHSAE
ncbi:MAG: prolipoprotein diacylglyceryl transferase [bacterium]|nr:prolipoprotein diacylglyceryl transferase [bacterium]